MLQPSPDQAEPPKPIQGCIWLPNHTKDKQLPTYIRQARLLPPFTQGVDLTLNTPQGSQRLTPIRRIAEEQFADVTNAERSVKMQLTTPIQRISEARSPTVIRRTSAERKAALELRKQQLEKQIADLESRDMAAARREETRRKIIIGAIALTRAKNDPEFEARLRTVLLDAAAEQDAKKKQRPHDLKVIFEYLGLPVPQSDRSTSEPAKDTATGSANTGAAPTP